MGKASEKKEAEVVVPQLTFLEEEHKALVDYMNLVEKFAKFNAMSQKESHLLSVVYVKSINVIKKIEDHIFEHKRTIQKAK